MTNQAVMQAILDALNSHDPDALLKVLADTTSEQRQAICNETFLKYPDLTPLMALTAVANKWGAEPLKAFLNGINAITRIWGMMERFPDPSQTETEFSQILANYHHGQDIIDLIVKTLGTNNNTLHEIFIEGLSDSDQNRIARMITARVKEIQQQEQQQREIEQNALVSSSTATTVEKNYPYERILELLSSQKLFDINKKAITQLKKFPDSAYGSADCYHIHAGLQYLSKIDLLNQETLTACLSITQTPGTTKSSWESPPEFNPEVFILLRQLGQFELRIDKSQFDSILGIKKENFERLISIISKLNDAKLLDNESFNKALIRVNDKLPIVEPSKVEKTNKDITGENRSKLTLVNEQMSIFPEPAIREGESKSILAKNQISGGAGTVKKAFAQNTRLEEEQPTFAIKKHNRDFITERHIAETKREARYYRLLNQPAYYFMKNNSPRLVTGWLKGKTLHQFSENALKNVSYENRIQWLISGFSDLNILHSHFRIHGDISENNFMINSDNNTMRLFDFGTAHKMGSSTGILTNTLLYTDPTSASNDFLKDIYAIGIICARLFPELYAIEPDKMSAKLTLIKTNLSPTEEAIVKLVTALTNPDRNARPTSEDALNFCNQLNSCKDNFASSKVQEIAHETIERKSFTTEDVLRGRQRP